MYKISTPILINYYILIIISIVAQIVVGSPISPNQMSKECGQITCQRHEYCTQFDHSCHSCDIICNKNSNNFDSGRCTTDCQDYLHDQIYTRNDDMKLESELWTLKILMIITLILTAITLSVLFIIFFLKMKRWRHKKKRSNSTLPSVIYNNKDLVQPVKRVPIRQPQPQGQFQERKPNHNNNTGGSMSSLPSREPSESTLPEYTYDNPALAPSPTNHI